MHRTGITYKPADALSRLETECPDERELNDEVPTLCIVDGEGHHSDEFVCAVCDTTDDGPSDDPILLLTNESTLLLTAPTQAEFLDAQATDPFCQQVAQTVSKPGSDFSYDAHGFLFRTARIEAPYRK